MEPSSQSDSGPIDLRILESQIRDSFGRVVYSHKTHEKCADILLDRLALVKLSQIILSAFTTGGFIAAVFGAGNVGAIIGILVSTALLILTSITKNYDLGALAQKHRQAGADLWLIRERYLSLLADLKSMSSSVESLRSRRDELLDDLHSVYSGAPSTTNKAYKKAQESLKQLEDLTFKDSEIDSFLPPELQLSK